MNIKKLKTNLRRAGYTQAARKLEKVPSFPVVRPDGAHRVIIEAHEGQYVATSGATYICDETDVYNLRPIRQRGRPPAEDPRHNLTIRFSEYELTRIRAGAKSNSVATFIRDVLTQYLDALEIY